MKYISSFAVGGSGLVVFACLFVAMPSAALEIAHSMQHPELGLFTSQANKKEASEECPNRGPEYAAWCGKPLLGIGDPQHVDLSSALLVAKVVGGGICTPFWQDYVLASIFDQIGTTNKYFLECGVRAPQRVNSAHFRLNCNWQGLLLDGAPSASPSLACPDCADAQALSSASETALVRLRRANLTQDTVNDVFNETKVPNSFDLLTVDMNGDEYWVLRGLDLKKFSPRVVAVRFSSYFNKDQLLVPKYQPGKVRHRPEVIGASLAALDGLMTGRGYSYVTQVAGEHAIWVLDSALNITDRNSTIPARVEEGWQSTSAEFNSTDFESPSPTRRVAVVSGAPVAQPADGKELTVQDLFTHYHPR